jgi:phospholipid/cholesterol/gamma-HCH transport system permease protein
MVPISVLTAPLSTVGRWMIVFIQELGKITIFFSIGVFHIFSPPPQFEKIIQQVFFIGAKSLLVIVLTGTFTGMVLGLQGYYTLSQFGSEGFLGAAVAASLIRELGPVLAAIMVIGRAGSAMTAEIGIMRISEQIDALETMDIDPVRFLVSPRIAASILSFPILTAVFDVIGILGGYVAGSELLGMTPGIYFSRVEANILMEDINSGFIKSIVFALLVATVCCYQGYYTHMRAGEFGAKGVSFSTTSAVVTSCVLVLVADYVITSLLL